MKIAGLQKLSLVDYPGLISSVVFLEGCNFHCPYCHNADLVRGCSSGEVTWDSALGFFSKRKNMIDGVVFSGGEPTLYEGLAEIMSAVKAIGYRIKLDTNGSRPDRLRELLNAQLLDFVAVDIKTSPERYHLVCDVEGMPDHLSTVRELLDTSGVEYEYRTTCAPGIVDEEDIHRIARAVKGAPRYVLQQFRPGNTLDKSFVEKRPYEQKELLRFKRIVESTVRDVLISGV